MKPLEGVTILEFSTMVTASFAAMMMGEQGADVIKVEPIEMGDPLRYIGTGKGGISALFANCNRGKRSIRVNLKCSEGVDIIRHLASTTDVVIHNFRPGVMEGLGLGSDTLRSLNPKLIYMAISGFGKQGPLGGAPAYDPVIQAHAGFTASQGRGEPVFVRNLMCDKITAYTACQAVTAALYQREKSGTGQHIDLSMLDAGLFFLFPDAFMNHTLLDEDVSIRPLLADLLYDLTPTADGAITMSAGTEKQQMGVLRAIGREDLRDDERFATDEAFAANVETYRSILKDGFARMSTAEALRALADNDVPAARCHDHEEVLSQAQFESNESLLTRRHPLMGEMRVMRSPPRFEGELAEPGHHSPAHGEHTREVLEAFGFDAPTIDALCESQVVA
ncbi:MAG: CoA transferase [Pseudomonadales bacterium]|nr:CoA transferase [Pseudomonadales bacterium]